MEKAKPKFHNGQHYRLARGLSETNTVYVYVDGHMLDTSSGQSMNPEGLRVTSFIPVRVP